MDKKDRDQAYSPRQQGRACVILRPSLRASASGTTHRSSLQNYRYPKRCRRHCLHHYRPPFGIVACQAINMRGHGIGGKDPHAEHSEPAEELHQPQLRIVLGICRKSRRSPSRPAFFQWVRWQARAPGISGIRRGIFFGKKYRHQNGGNKKSSPDIKGVFDIVGDPIRAGDLAETQPASQYWSGRIRHRSQPDQKGLDGKTEGPLAVRKIVGHQRPEWLHGNIEGGIHDHDESGADPQGGDHTSQTTGIG
jgi:hypothetical protein